MNTHAAAILTSTELRERLGRFPRVALAHLPTPLDFCPRLSAALGGPKIYIKRDDMTGLAFGGNKTRQLEFLFSRILAQGCDTVVAGAYTQSNWCRQITAACCKLGLQASLVLIHGVKGPRLQGNLLLDKVMGADVTVVDIDTMEKLTPLLQAKADELRAQGRKPFVVAPFDIDSLALATLGYVNAALEIDEQLSTHNAGADFLYVCGANMTPAGLAVGMRALGRKTQVIGIAPIHWSEPRANDIARIASASAQLLDLGFGFAAEEIHCDEGYVGVKYGIMTPECRAALKLVAATEGIILDPVYTSKAMAGLIDHIRRGRIGKDQTVVFVHTGGVPALFAYAEDLELQ